MNRRALLACLTALMGTCAAGAPAALGAVPGAQRETIQVWMTGRPQAAQRFVDAVSTPGSPSYHRYLSPIAYAQRFGPRASQAAAVRAYLVGAGFTGIRASPGGDYVSATAPATAIDWRASLPAALREDVLAVTGRGGPSRQVDGAMSDAVAPGNPPSAPPCSRYWGQKIHAIHPAFDGITRAAVAVCGYSAAQIRGAYGLGSARDRHTPDGRGVTIALVQGDGAPYEMFRTLTEYARADGLPRPSRARYRQEAAGGSSRRGCDSQDDTTDEGALDSEVAYTFAPGATQLMVDGNGCLGGEDHDEGLLDAELEPLTGHGTRPQATIESVSYGLGSEKGLSASLQRVSHAIALRAAAEGVSLLFSSGDDPGPQPQADDPDVTAVGGTTLGIGAHGRRIFETGWSDALITRRRDTGPWHDRGISFAAGGGASAIYGEPSYQQGVVPGPLALNRVGQPGRAMPDIAADADSATGMRLGVIDTPLHGGAAAYGPFIGSGTSQATPLVAGMVADAEQGRRSSLGFLNPLLYSLAGSRAFHDILPVTSATPPIDRVAYSTVSPLPNIGGSGAVAPYLFTFDDQDRRFTTQVTAPGYDTMTGLGSPDGMAFIRALHSAASSTSLEASAVPGSAW